MRKRSAVWGMEIRSWAFLGILAIAALLFTRGSIDGELLNYDDERYIENNDLIENFSPEGVGEIFTSYFDGHYHPLTLLSLAIDRSLSEDAVFSHHRTNWWLHLFNSILVFFLLSRLFPERELLAFGTSLLFLLHPMNVESYAWMTERKNVLYSFFFLLACWQYVRYANDTKRKALLLVTYVFLLLSLLSKAQAVVLLPVFFLIDYVRNRSFSAVAIYLEKLPALLIFSAFLFITREAQVEEWGNLSSEVYSRLDKLFLASTGFALYLLKGVVPIQLSPYYPYPEALGLSLSSVHYAAVLVPLAFIGLLVVLIRNDQRIWVWGLAFFFLNIVLMLKFLDVPYGDYLMANRYIYLPSIGLIWTVLLLVNHLLAKKGSKMNLAYVISALAIWYGWKSIERIDVWSSSTNLWASVIEQYPNYAHARNMKALAHLQKGEAREALNGFKMLLEIDPDFEGGRQNLATLYYKTGQKEAALAQARLAARENPENIGALGLAYRLESEMNKHEAALLLAQKMKALDSNDENHILNEARSLIALKRLDEAQAVLIQSTSEEAGELLLAIQRQQSATDPSRIEAAELLDEATRLGKAGNHSRAIVLFTRSIELDSTNFKSYLNRGTSYARSGEFALAYNDFERARKLRPSNGATYLMLAAVSRDLGRTEEMCGHVTKAKKRGAQVPAEMLQLCTE